MTLEELEEVTSEVLSEVCAMAREEGERRWNEFLAGLPVKARRIVKSSAAAGRLIYAAQTQQQVNFTNCSFKDVPNFFGNNTTQIDMSETHNEQKITGGTFSGPVGVNQNFTNCYNTANVASDAKVQEMLTALISEVEKLFPKLADNQKATAERRLKLLTEEAVLEKPDKEQLSLSGKGLIEAAQTCAGISGPVITCVQALLAFFGVG